MVLARTSGTNANNVASATFSGGVSTIEKITLGFDAAVTAGSATLTVNGGTLYLGAGGIVRNGAGTFATTLNFSAGTVGARNNWTSSVPIALPLGGNIVFKAADAFDQPRDITLTGSLSGAGGLTKAGLGTLALGAANTFTGPVAVNAGVLLVDGSLAPGDLVSINGGGLLAGTGTVGRAVLLGAVITLATFASTEPWRRISPTAGCPIAAAFSSSPQPVSRSSSPARDRRPHTDWAYQAGLPADQQGAAQDPDNDGLVNLLEFVLARDPLQTNVSGIAATTVVVDGQRFPAVTFVQRLDLGSLTVGALTSADLAFASLLGSEQVSSTPIDAGLAQVVIRSLVPLAQRPTQFFRLAATLPAQPAEIMVSSSPVGVMSGRMDRGLSGHAVPLISADHFVGVVASNTASRLAFSASDGSIGSLLAVGGAYYVEVVTGPLAGERFDVDTVTTMASNDATVTVSIGPGSLSTLPVLIPDALAGARCVLRSHLTLSRLQQMLTPGLVGRDHPVLADGVDVLENGRAERYYLRADGMTWRKAGSTEDFRDKVLSPDQSFMVESRYAAQGWRHAGIVRANALRKNLVRGLQSFASGFPQDLSPFQIGASVDPGAPAVSRWTGNNVSAFADQIHVLLGEPRPWEFFYLRGNGSTWRPLVGTTDVTHAPILGATSLILVRRVNADGTFRVPLPFVP